MIFDRSERDARNDRLRVQWLKDAKVRLKAYNSKEALLVWAGQAVAKLPKEEQETLLAVAKDEIKKGGWRGDVSEKWMARGYTTADIPDLYP